MVRQAALSLDLFPSKPTTFWYKKNDLSSHFTLGGERRVLVPMHDRSRQDIVRRCLYKTSKKSRKEQLKAAFSPSIRQHFLNRFSGR
jgi:hypothetical protein